MSTALVALGFIAGCGASTQALEEDNSLSTHAFGDSIDDLVIPGEDGPPATAPEGYELFGWEDLLVPGASADDDNAEFEKRLTEVEYGTPEADALYEEWQAETEAKGQIVNTELDGKKIHMAGFVTPLDYEADVITEFLFVPYFGACIHVPPPPVNQTVMVKLDKDQALSIEDTWGAVWVTGQLSVTSETTDLATAGYIITDASTEVAENYF